MGDWERVRGWEMCARREREREGRAWATRTGMATSTATATHTHVEVVERSVLGSVLVGDLRSARATRPPHRPRRAAAAAPHRAWYGAGGAGALLVRNRRRAERLAAGARLPYTSQSIPRGATRTPASTPRRRRRRHPRDATRATTQSNASGHYRRVLHYLNFKNNIEVDHSSGRRMASLKKKKKKGGSKLMNKALTFYLTSVETPLREWCRAHVEPFDDPSIDWTASSIEMRHEWHSVYADVRVAPRRACAAASSCRGARVFHRRRTPHSTRARSLSPHSRTPNLGATAHTSHTTHRSFARSSRR